MKIKNKFENGFGIVMIVGFLLITLFGCGPIISRIKYVIKDTDDNNWIEKNSKNYYYYCDDCKIEISTDKIYGYGTWFMCCILPIIQENPDKNRLRLSLHVSDKKNDLPIRDIPMMRKNSLKIFADGKIVMPNTSKELEALTYRREGQEPIKYNSYVY